MNVSSQRVIEWIEEGQRLVQELFEGQHALSVRAEALGQECARLEEERKELRQSQDHLRDREELAVKLTTLIDEMIQPMGAIAQKLVALQKLRVQGPGGRQGRTGSARYVAVVARNHPEVYEYLMRRFAGDPEVDVLLDRRRADRRGNVSTRVPERRVTDRRRATGSLETLHIACVLMTRQRG